MIVIIKTIKAVGLSNLIRGTQKIQQKNNNITVSLRSFQPFKDSFL